MRGREESFPLRVQGPHWAVHSESLPPEPFDTPLPVGARETWMAQRYGKKGDYTSSCANPRPTAVRVIASTAFQLFEGAVVCAETSFDIPHTAPAEWMRRRATFRVSVRAKCGAENMRPAAGLGDFLRDITSPHRAIGGGPSRENAEERFKGPGTAAAPLANFAGPAWSPVM